MTHLRPHRLAAAVTGLVVALALLAAWPGAATAKKARADMVVTTVTAPASVVRGATATLGLVVRNRGRRAAPRSTSGWYLSTDRNWSTGDRLLGTVRLPRLRPGARASRTARLRVPATTAGGQWWVVGCADVTRRVRELRERNNCGATARLRVTEAPVDPPTDPRVPDFPLEPHPLDVGDAHLEDDRAVTETAAAHEQSVIATTASDGTTYTLTVPADALLSPEPITLTPVTAMDGLPLSGGLVAGVQIEPHGLLLLRPAELTIESPDAGPVATQTAFLFHEGGTDFHLFPMEPPAEGDDADVVRLRLTHFSTPGVGGSTAGERQDLAARVPDHRLSQVEAAIAELFRVERVAQLAEQPADPGVARHAAALLDSYYDGVLRQLLVTAETNADLAAEAVAAGLGWSRQVQLLGDATNPRHDEILERVDRILQHVMTQRWAECQAHDLRALHDLFGLARTAALLSTAWQQDAWERALGCARFEVRLESVITSVGQYSGTLQSGRHQGRWATTATVEVEALDPDATGPLSYREFAWSSTNTIHEDPECTTTEVGTTTTPGRLRAFALPRLPSLNTVEGPAPRLVPPFLTGVSVPGGESRPAEGYRRTPCNGPVEDRTEHQWASRFGQMRPNPQWETNPERQDLDLIDAKTWQSTVVGDTSTQTERTDVEVWHRPRL